MAISQHAVFLHKWPWAATSYKLYLCVRVCEQEGRGSGQEGVASKGAEEEEEDEEDDQENQKQ